MLLMGSSSGTEFEDTRKSNKTANNSRLTNKRPVGGELRAEGHGGYIIQYSSNMTIVKYCLHITSMIQCIRHLYLAVRGLWRAGALEVTY